MPNFEIRDLSIPDFHKHAVVNQQVIEAIDSGLTSFNASTQPDPNASPLLLSIYDGSEEVCAGLTGRSAYDWLRIDVLWVSDGLRGEGYGAALLARAEHIAMERGCRGVHLDTHGFQAPDFYLRFGYEVFGSLPDYPTGYGHYFLKKHLIPDPS